MIVALFFNFALVAFAGPRAVSSMPYRVALPMGRRVVAPAGGPLLIMPLGEGRYRLELYRLLRNAAFQFRFVGSLAQGPAELPEKNYEGGPEASIEQLTSAIDTALARYSPDFVLLEIGVRAPAAPEQKIQALANRIATRLPKSYVLVANSGPHLSTAETAHNPRVRAVTVEAASSEAVLAQRWFAAFESALKAQNAALE